jgi:hypothetical protein
MNYRTVVIWGPGEEKWNARTEAEARSHQQIARPLVEDLQGVPVNWETVNDWFGGAGGKVTRFWIDKESAESYLEWLKTFPHQPLSATLEMD